MCLEKMKEGTLCSIFYAGINYTGFFSHIVTDLPSIVEQYYNTSPAEYIRSHSDKLSSKLCARSDEDKACFFCFDDECEGKGEYIFLPIECIAVIEHPGSELFKIVGKIVEQIVDHYTSFKKEIKDGKLEHQYTGYWLPW